MKDNKHRLYRVKITPKNEEMLIRFTLNHKLGKLYIRSIRSRKGKEIKDIKDIIVSQRKDEGGLLNNFSTAERRKIMRKDCECNNPKVHKSNVRQTFCLDCNGRVKIKKLNINK